MDSIGSRHFVSRFAWLHSRNLKVFLYAPPIGSNVVQILRYQSRSAILLDMELSTLTQEAKNIQEAYAALNQRSGRRPWGPAEYAQGLVGDVGDLVKLVMAKENFRSAENVDAKLTHELGDCLWSLLVLADSLGVDLERAFLGTMKELQEKTQEGQNSDLVVRSAPHERTL